MTPAFQPVAIPADDYRRTRVARRTPRHHGLNALAHAAFGKIQRAFGGRERTRLAQTAREVLALREEVAGLDSSELKRRLNEMRKVVRRRGRDAGREETIVAALALAAEAARRSVGGEPDSAQVMAAAALMRGRVVEFAGVEGRATALALAAVWHGWRREPCHVIVASDFLAARAAQRWAPFFAMCQVTAAAIRADAEAEARRRIYDHDVVYSTARELAVDFLRDRLRLGSLQDPSRRMIRSLYRGGRMSGSQLVMRGIHAALVDDADHVLLDEAVSPVVISRARQDVRLGVASLMAREAALKLKVGEEYRINHEERSIELTAKADVTLASAAENAGGSYGAPAVMREMVLLALRAEHLFHREVHYVVQDGKVVVLDEITGQPVPGRSWRQGFHQAVETKEDLPVTDPVETVVRISYPHFFRSFARLAAISGTAREAAGELWSYYEMPLLIVPAARGLRPRRLPAKVFSEEASKWEAVAGEIAGLKDGGDLPVLVCTQTAQAREEIARRLRRREIEFQVVDSVTAESEASRLARAGRPGSVTIMTGQAGRGISIDLDERDSTSGGLEVLSVEDGNSERLSRATMNRAAPERCRGSFRRFVSVEDELVKRFVPAWMWRAARWGVGKRIPGFRRVFLSFLVPLTRRRAERLGRLQRDLLERQDAAAQSGPGRRFPRI